MRADNHTKETIIPVAIENLTNMQRAVANNELNSNQIYMCLNHICRMLKEPENFLTDGTVIY